MHYKNFFYFLCFFFVMFISACSDEPENPENSSENNFSGRRGFFIINEGLFQQANASIDFYDLDTKEVLHDIFFTANQRPLGDVAQSMNKIGNKIWIVVNNSGKIEIVKSKNFKSIMTLTGFTSPRYLLFHTNGKAYLSDLYKESLYVIDTLTGQTIKEISTSKSCEYLIEAGNYIFALNWSSLNDSLNNTVTIIDALSDSAIKSVILTKEPNSAAIDKNGNIWILCSGGFFYEETPALYCMNPQGEILKKLEFFGNQPYPTRLCINPSRDTLFYLNKDVYRMGIADDDLPSLPFIQANNRSLYGLDAGNYILLSDPLDYQQNGNIYVYSRSGQLLSTFRAGMIPSGFLWNE